MRWYDYVTCYLFADVITAGLFSGNWVVLGAGVLGYDVYESYRKSSKTK